MWSCIVERGTPSSDDRFRVDFIGERSMEAATAAHVSKRVVFLWLRQITCALSWTLLPTCREVRDVCLCVQHQGARTDPLDK